MATKANTRTRVKRNKTSEVNQNVPQDQRIEMISTAAYFIAEKRGFDNGDPEADWLLAESQFDESLELED